jgi:Tol biopolymer transport system component
MGYLMTALTASIPLVTSIAAKELAWTPEVLIHTKLISDVQISPDNTSVLFVVTEPEMVKTQGSLVSRIYKTLSDGKNAPVPFSAAHLSSTQPRWSPDGQWIAFLSTRNGVKNLYLIRSEGGEAVALTKGKKDVQTFAWSPDGEKIAFVMGDITETAKREKKTSLACVYRHNDPINRLWLIDPFAYDLSLDRKYRLPGKTGAL